MDRPLKTLYLAFFINIILNLIWEENSNIVFKLKEQFKREISLLGKC